MSNVSIDDIEDATLRSRTPSVSSSSVTQEAQEAQEAPVEEAPKPKPQIEQKVSWYNEDSRFAYFTFIVSIKSRRSDKTEALTWPWRAHAYSQDRYRSSKTVRIVFYWKKTRDNFSWNFYFSSPNE